MIRIITDIIITLVDLLQKSSIRLTKKCCKTKKNFT